MLEIFNTLKPFFEDTYKELSIRSYAKIQNISPPKASVDLKNLHNEGVLITTEVGKYNYYKANKNSFLFKELSKLYWYQKLYDLTEEFHNKVLFKKIILFGSTSKCENTTDSDIDLFIDISKREIDISNLEKQLNRKIELHFKESMKNINLKNNIEKGIMIR